MNTTIKSSAINYGLYLGGLLSILTILAYAINLDLFANMWFGISMLIAIIIFGIISTIKSRNILNGFISFKDAFTSYFITIVIGLLISSIISIVIFNFIDPEAATILKEKIMDAQVEGMRNWGAPEEAIEKAVEKFEAQDNMYSIGNVLQSLMFQIIGFSVVGLISSLILKKEDPNA